jgi:hypothetical protein
MRVLEPACLQKLVAQAFHRHSIKESQAWEWIWGGQLP